MNRYYYYHILYVGMMNVMLFVPHILIQKRFEGAVSGLLIAIAVGTVLSLTTTWCFERFAGMAAPDVLARYCPRWTATLLIAVATFVWISGGVLALYSFARTMGIFFNPEMNDYLFLLLIVFASVCAASRSTRSVQFALEILLLVSSPLIVLILFKSMTNMTIRWDSVRVVLGYVRTVPSFQSVVAATFMFSGYMNITLFNRLNPQGFKVRHKWVIPLICSFFIFFSFLIPVGFHGTMAVQEYVYLWSVTADSMQMKYGFVQRVLFTFLVLYCILSLMFVMTTFHAAMEFCKSFRPGRRPSTEEWPVPKSNWILCGLFGLLSFAYMGWANEGRNQWATTVWLELRFYMEIVTMLVMLLIVARARKQARRSSLARGRAACGE